MFPVNVIKDKVKLKIPPYPLFSLVSPSLQRKPSLTVSSVCILLELCCPVWQPVAIGAIGRLELASPT